MNAAPGTNTPAIRAALGLLTEPGQVMELRIIGVDGRATRTDSGYFDDPDALAKAAARYDGRATAVYVTLHPVMPALLARASNRMQEWAKQTTNDTETICRRWLLIDTDPTRPAGISATDDEHAAALARARAVRDWLMGQGWPEPIYADSGNGAHLLYRIDLAADDGGLTQRVLAEVAGLFDDRIVTVDRTVYNRSRISKLYGTLARKGDSTPDRPHRRACILEAPDTVSVVPMALLESLAPAPTQASTDHTGTTGRKSGFDVEAYLRAHGIAFSDAVPYNGGKKWHLDSCVWNAHTDRAAIVTMDANGVIGANCSHNSCEGKGWKDLRDKVEPGWREAREARERAYQERTGTASQAAPLPAESPPVDMETRQFRVYTASEMKARDPVSFLVEGLIPDEALVTLIGKPGHLKSFIAMDVGLSLASGAPWHGRDTQHGPVLYVSGEGAGGIGQRIAAWETARSRIAPDTFLVITDAPQLLNIEHVDAIITTARVHHVRVVFLDTLARTMGGDENSTRDMSDFVTAANRVQREGHTAVVVVHHMGWNADRGRGSSALFAAVDVEATVTREDKTGPVSIAITKAKEFEEPAPLILMPRVVTLPNGSTSLALDTAAPDPSRVSDETRRVGRILLDTFGAAGATATQWQKAAEEAGIKSTRFYAGRTQLAMLGHITVPRDDKEKRGWFYRATDAFTSSLRDHSGLTSQSVENDHFVTSGALYSPEVRSDFSGLNGVTPQGVTSEASRPPTGPPREPHLWPVLPRGVTYRPPEGTTP